MSAPTYRPTDLVLVGDPRAGAFYAEVIRTSRDGLLRGRLEVRGVHGSRLRREVLTRDVRLHWRRVR
jgi:hypothetical protein